MKKTIRESIVDYDMAMLRALAEARGAALTTNHQSTAVDELAVQLSAPASVAIVLTELSAAERKALAALQAEGGWMETPRFARRFGAVRAMGPARLERERPWQSPVNPAEGLWYRGLIFKSFRQAQAGVVEVMYIPDDLLVLLGEVSTDSSSLLEMTPSLDLEPIDTPDQTSSAGTDLIEDVFGVLVYVRNHRVRINADGKLLPRDLQAINSLCASPLPPADVAEDDRIAFVLHLCRAANLVAEDDGHHLVLNPDSTRAWLQAGPGHRLLSLHTAWRDDPYWNDLWHVPSLKPQATGWKNNPILARRKVLGFLTCCQPNSWYSLDSFVAAVKSSDPDFQRPDGDYTTWYIHDRQGQPLMGFEHWDQVEGALLRYLLSGPLYWLGVTDLGFEKGVTSPFAFRLAETGLVLLEMASPPEEEAAPEAPPFAVRDDLLVRVSLDADLYDRFQLARFADFAGRDADRVSYRISPASLARARQQGIALEQIGAFLTRASGDRVPSSVMDKLRNLDNLLGTVRLEQGTVLRVDRPEVLKALRRDAAIVPLLGEVLGPQAVLVPKANVSKVRRWLAERGYLKT